MRNAIIILFTLLFSTSIAPQVVLQPTKAIADSESSIGTWDLSINPTQGQCMAKISSAWSPTSNWIIAEENQFTDIDAGTVRLEVDCEDGSFNHTSAIQPDIGNSTEVLLEHSWNGTLVNISGANSLSWWNQNGSIDSDTDSVETLLNESGWLLISNDYGQLLTSEMNSSVADVGFFNHSFETSITDLVRIIHKNSGYIIYAQANEGWLNFSLPLLDLGEEWSVIHNNQQSNIIENLGNWLNNTTPSASKGQAILEFMEAPLPGSDFEIEWSAQHLFGTGMGSTLLPSWGLPLETQIDLYLQGDESAFTNLLNSSSWFESLDGLCCSMDGVDLNSPQGISIEGFIENDGQWGWNENGNLAAQRNHVPYALLTLILNDDARQSTPIQVRLPSTWEYRSSSDESWIDGNPNNFTISRDLSGLSGGFIISIGENTAPQVSTQLDGYQAWDLPINITSSSSDHGLGSLNCIWEFIAEDNISHHFSQSSFILNASEISGWQSGQQVNFSHTCSDYYEIEASAEGNIILDGDLPWIQNSTSNVSCDGAKITVVDIMQCDEIAVVAGERVYLQTAAIDNTSSTSVHWFSNKSEGWNEAGSLASIVFHQGTEVNQVGMSVEERQGQRNTSHHSLTIEVKDGVGHLVKKTWNVEVFDGTGPIIKPRLWIEDVGLMTPSNQPRAGESLWLNISESFDDISAAANVIYTISLDDEILPEKAGVSFASAINTSLPEMSIGNHRILIEAIDEAGNVAKYNLDIQIHPLDIVSLKVLDVQHPEDGIRPGAYEIIIKVVNEGSRGGQMRLCIGSDCIERMMPTATPYGPGEDEITLIWNADDDEVLELTVEWENTAGEWESYAIRTGVTADEPWTTIETFAFWIFAIVLGGVVIIMMRKANL